MWHVDVITVGFFEDCIAEEQFEAQKLDIMRDALRAKTSYTTTTKNMEKIHESPEPPSPKEPLSPINTSPMPVSPIPPETETAPNGASRNTNASESVGGADAVTNGDSVEGSEVVANGNAGKSIEGSEVVANGDADKSVTNGDSSQPESKIPNGHDEVANGVPETVWTHMHY